MIKFRSAGFVLKNCLEWRVKYFELATKR